MSALLAAFALLLLFVSDAFAVNWTLKMCVRVNTDYTDVDNGEDRWLDADTASQAGRGFQLRVFDDTTDSFVWPNEIGSWGASEDGDTDTGCTDDIIMDSNHDYDLFAHSVAVVDGHTINAYDQEESPSIAATELVMNDFSPSSANDVSGFVDGSTDARWNHLALVAYALKMHDGNASADTFTIYEDGNGCGVSSGPESHFDPASPCSKRKFIVAHEFGHQVANVSDAGPNSANASLPDTDDCQGGGGGIITKAYPKKAFREGAATLYSAFTWNDIADEDCVFAMSAVDFDLDGEDDFEGPEGLVWPPCVGDPLTPSTPFLNDRDWLEDLVIGDDDNPGGDGKDCDGELDNRLTEYDVVRYFWELVTEQSVEMSDFWEIWDDADPMGSDPDDNDTGSEESTSTDDDTLVMWEEAMDANGHGDAHDDLQDHGLCRHDCYP